MGCERALVRPILTDLELETLASDIRAARQAFLSGGAYNAATVERHAQQTTEFRKRLLALPYKTWAVPDQVDWYVVLTEVNHDAFLHRVLRPWARDPAHYLALVLGRQLEPEQPSGEEASAIAAMLDKAPSLLEGARSYLSELTRSHAELVLHDIETQQDSSRFHPRYQGPVARLEGIATRAAAGGQQRLADAAANATRAVRAFGVWLRSRLDTLNDQGGVGLDNLTWYIRNVYLAPVTASQVRTLAERDYERSMANLAYDENHNRGLPPLTRATTETEYVARDADGERLARRWMEQGNIFTLESDIPAVISANVAFQEHLDWWHETLFREPLVDKLHAGIPGHWYDAHFSSRHVRPVRAGYNASRIRSEGWALHLEEMALESGLLDERPRSREIFHLWQAYRYLRVLFEMDIADGRMTPTEAVQYQIDNVPLMRPRDDTAWMEAAIAFRSPPSQSMYVIGKYQIERLIARRRLALGDKFDLRALHDGVFRAGLIPFSLISWELTGDDSDLRQVEPELALA